MTDADTGTLFMIGNAHLDPVWLWTWQEGFQEAKATFRSALDRMREYDDFLFTSSSAGLYEWIEHNDPTMFEEIKQRVQEGRWEIVGGWWIQPDCNIPSGESLVRQGLYGQRFLKEKLGVTATVGYNVDSFGHAASLPQILLKSGLTSYIFMRPHPHEQRLPSRLFWWESDDGSRVLTFRIPYEYCTWGKGLQQHVERCAAEFRGSLNELMCFYGVGNHGGGPTRENIESIRAMDAEASYPRLLFSTPGRYFESVRQSTFDPPVFHDELQHHASGCYAAHSGVKRWNREAENWLATAEKLSALAWREGCLPYPEDLAHAWKGVLFNQFHDILGGASIEPAYQDARDLHGEAMAIGARHLNNAVQALSWRVNIEQEEGVRPLVVFNPHCWPVRAPAEVEFGRLPEGAVLLDSEGIETPLQPVRSYATVSSGSRNRLSFLAEVPAFGYQTYRVASRPSSREFPAVQADDLSLENSHFRLEINPDSGCIRSLYDKHLEFEWLRREGARPVVLDDPSDTWSHGVLRFESVIGEFSARTTRLVEHGPVQSVIRVESEYGSSFLTQDFIMYPELGHIDIQVTVDWREHFKLLKLRFPLNLDFTTATYEIPYGHIERPANGEEEAGQRWIDVGGVGRGNGKLLGMSILNNGKYSFDVKDYDVGITVLRSPIYAHHAPYQPQPQGRYTFIDQGIQRFTYSLLPHTGSWRTAGTVRRAAELNQPLMVQAESCHPGPLPQTASYLSIDAENVDITVVKRAEDGDDLILRCFETAGRTTHSTIRLPAWARTIETDFHPNELKTFRVPRNEGEPVREVNLIEW